MKLLTLIFILGCLSMGCAGSGKKWGRAFAAGLQGAGSGLQNASRSSDTTYENCYTNNYGGGYSTATCTKGE